MLFSLLFTILFNFPSRYYCAIGLDMYLGLDVNNTHIHQQYPMPATRESDILPTSTTELSSSMVLYSKRLRLVG